MYNPVTQYNLGLHLRPICRLAIPSHFFPDTFIRLGCLIGATW